MIESIFIGIFTALLLTLSSIISKLLSLISKSIGSRVPYLFLFIGISFGGEMKHGQTAFYWPSFISSLAIATILLYIFANQNTTETFESGNPKSIKIPCAVMFILGCLIGMIYHLIRYNKN